MRHWYLTHGRGLIIIVDFGKRDGMVLVSQGRRWTLFVIQNGLETRDDVTHIKIMGDVDMNGMHSQGKISSVGLSLLHISKPERLVRGNGLVRMPAVTRLCNCIRGTSYASLHVLEDCRAITNVFTW